MIKSYKLEELVQNDTERLVLACCQQSALLRPWAKTLLLHPSDRITRRTVQDKIWLYGQGFDAHARQKFGLPVEGS